MNEEVELDGALLVRIVSWTDSVQFHCAASDRLLLWGLAVDANVCSSVKRSAPRI
jgi:hypothetical protein